MDQLNEILIWRKVHFLHKNRSRLSLSRVYWFLLFFLWCHCARYEEEKGPQAIDAFEARFSACCGACNSSRSSFWPCIADSKTVQRIVQTVLWPNYAQLLLLQSYLQHHVMAETVLFTQIGVCPIRERKYANKLRFSIERSLTEGAAIFTMHTMDRPNCYPKQTGPNQSS